MVAEESSTLQGDKSLIRINSPKPSILIHPTIFAQLDPKTSNNSEFPILRERKSKSKAVMTSNE